MPDPALDKRRLLRASPPDKRLGRCVQVHLDAADYERAWFLAFEAELSLADMIRTLIRRAANADTR